MLDGVEIPTCEEAVLKAKRGRIRTRPDIGNCDAKRCHHSLACNFAECSPMPSNSAVDL